MRRLAALVLTAFATAVLPLGAQATHPNFSGSWSLDTSKLEGPLMQAGVTSATLKISQDEKTMKQDQSIAMAMGTQSSSETYNLDGTESKNTITQGPQSIELTSTTSWDGPALVISTKGDLQGTPLVRTDRYALDASGKVLTIDSSMSVMGQSLSFKQTFSKP